MIFNLFKKKPTDEELLNELWQENIELGGKVKFQELMLKSKDEIIAGLHDIIDRMERGEEIPTYTGVIVHGMSQVKPKALKKERE